MSTARAARATRAKAAERRQPQFNPAESPIGWLSRRRDKDGRPLISEEQRLSGERLRADFTYAQMTPRVTADWSPVAPGSGCRRSHSAGADHQDNVIAAGERVRRALASVGPELAGILIDVCCHLKGLEEVERHARWPQRSAKLLLHVALNSLARHYGIIHDRDAHDAGRVLSWGAPGYRPEIMSGDG